MQRFTIDTEEVRWHKCFSRNLLLDPGITVDQGNQDKVWQVKSPVSCNSFACLLYIYPVARGKRRLLTDRGGQRTRVRLDRWFLRCQRETAGLTPDNLEPQTRVDSIKPSNSLSASFLLSLVLGEGGLIGPGGVLGPQMGAGLLEPDRVINPVKRHQPFQLPLEAYALPLLARRSPGFSPLIRPHKLDQAGIDGVGEHCSKHCVSQSERR